MPSNQITNPSGQSFECGPAQFCSNTWYHHTGIQGYRYSAVVTGSVVSPKVTNVPNVVEPFRILWNLVEPCRVTHGEKNAP